jgi:uncharacterized membrane protein
VGSYSDTSSDEATGATAYLLTDGRYLTINPPGATQSWALGISESGDYVGGALLDGGGNQHGFLYENGVFTQIDFPAGTQSQIYNLNDSGVIVGSYLGADGTTYGFIRTPSDAPEPTLLALLGAGLAGLCMIRRRKNNQSFRTARLP